MKQNFSKYMLFAALMASPLCGFAQYDEDDEDVEEAPSVEKVHVAFRDVDADKLLGGVSFVNMIELQKKDYTRGSLDDLSALVGGWNGGNLWGMDNDRLDNNDNGNLPVVLIDGVKRPSNNVLPSEIEQVTFLKGAQAVVLYGAKAAKGVILITTKRAKNDGLRINVDANTGFHVAKAFPQYIGSAEYMTLYNEARQNDYLDPKYTQQDIYNHAAGLNPYRYPNTNWYSEDYVRKAYNRSEATVEIQGGAERARFYTNVNYYRSEDLLDFGIAKDNYTDRFSVRGNVDLKVNRYISAYVDASATFYNENKNKGDFWSEASSVRPNFPENAAPLIPIDFIDPNATKALAILGKSINLLDGKFFPGGTQATRKNAIAECYFGGKATDISRQFQFDAGIDYDMNHLLKGLSFKTLFAIDYAAKYRLEYNNEYAVFIPTWSNYNGTQDVIAALKQEGDERQTGTQSMSNSSYRQTISWNGHFDYDRTFGDHHVSGILLGNLFTTTASGKYHRYANVNLGLQASYDYKGLYFAEVGAAGIHSARLPEGNRQALSPSATLGWRLGKESFMDNTFVDDLMLSASYSSLNEDMDIYLGDKEFYIYDALWATSGGSFQWKENSSVDYTYSTTGSNPVLECVKRKEFSINLRGSFFKEVLNADLSFFRSTMDGYIVKNPTTFPSHLQNGLSGGTFKPAINHDANTRTGFDFNIKVQETFGNLYAALGFTGTYLKTEMSKYDELLDSKASYVCEHHPEGHYYQNNEGRPIDTIWGLKCLGFYTENDFLIDANGKYVLRKDIPQPNLGGSVQPGDLKYYDQNGDGAIDRYDQVDLGTSGAFGAPLTLGVNLTLKWKGFTLFVLGTGNYGAYAMRNNNTYYYPTGESKYSIYARDRWTPATADTAKYPRLTTQGGQHNNQASDFWLYKTDRFDIRKVQLTYDMPELWFDNKVVKAMTIYVAGHDLLTISEERKHMETNVGYAPQTRFYNLGVKLTF